MSAYRFRNRLPKPGEGKSPRAQLDASQDAGGIVVLWLYDVIDSWGGFWGTSADEVRQALEAFPASQVTAIHVHVNSPGGDVFEAAAINNILAAHPAAVTVMVDGLAASAASVVATRADECVMGVGTEMMIHEASTIVWGTASDLQAAASLCDKVSGDVASQYAMKGGGDPQQWRDLMLANTWFTAQEAVDAGLADRVGTLTEADPVQSVTEGDDESEADLLFAASLAGLDSSPRAAAALARAHHVAVIPDTEPTARQPAAPVAALAEAVTADEELAYQYRARAALRK